MSFRPVLLGLMTALVLVLDALVPCFATPTAQHAPNTANAQALRREEEPEPPGLGPLTPSEKQAFGCLLGGTTALSVAAATTGLNVMVGLYTGTTVVPVAGTGLWLVAGGTIFATACGVGALVTPGVLRLWQYFVVGTPSAR